jgi:hypothetical protein
MGVPLLPRFDVVPIFAKPGRTWTPVEKTRVTEWLNEPPQRPYYRIVGWRKLGVRAVEQDADEAWQEFFTSREDGTSRYDKVVEKYDPQRFTSPAFPGYFQTCWVRFCLAMGRKLRVYQTHVRTGVI